MDGNVDQLDSAILALSTKLTQVLQNDEASLKLFDKPVESLNVVDVYNIASSVGQEFERLTDAFGGIVFSGVMPKIIRILEMLEALVSKREKDSDEVAELNSSLQKLEMESKLKDKKQQEEIEIVESAWKDETRNLLETVSTLEEDNQKLTSLLTEKLKDDSNHDDIALPEQQASVITKLQLQITNQRDDIRSKNACLEERASEIDALQSQIQRLTTLNADIRNKIYILEKQGKALIDEKAELEAKVNQRDRTFTELQLKSVTQDKKNKDLTDETKSEHRCDAHNDPNITIDPLVANKLVIDLNDPNRPRYTLQELQEVLNDRNQLKAKCFLLEEELIYHRGEETWEELDDHEIHESRLQAHKHLQHHEVPESGIRKFFHFLAGDTSWRNRPVSYQKKHEIVEEDISNKELVNPNDIRELVPDANELLQLSKELDFSMNSSSLPMMSPVLEREELTP